jgi:predicted unusual protein kinase regulating ubiquinone biosynthesis (AarF/ABC1/UbiB family)
VATVSWLAVWVCSLAGLHAAAAVVVPVPLVVALLELPADAAFCVEPQALSSSAPSTGRQAARWRGRARKRTNLHARARDRTALRRTPPGYLSSESTMAATSDPSEPPEPARESRPPTRGRIARTARLGRVAVGGAGRWAGDRLDVRGSEEEQRRRRGDRVVATIDALVDQLAVMRGAAMKAGQVLSTIEFPGLDADQSAHLQQRLASLRDDVPPVQWKQMRRVLEQEWGQAPEKVLAHIDSEPAAAASIGQVYRGRDEDGRELAIKVQYPGVAESVESDMRNLRLLSPLLRQLMPGLDIQPVLTELRERTAEECDYELEAANHRRVQRFWQGHPFVLVPRVDTELSRRRVLVTEWVDGIGFDDVCRQPDDVRDRYVEIVYRFFYETVLSLGLALGDPHPGNYLLCPDGRVAFFDFGMMRRLPADYLRREGAIARAVRESDEAGVVAGMRELGYLPGDAADWDGALLLRYMRAVSWWLYEEEPLRLDPEDLWRSSVELRGEAGKTQIAQLRRMTVPPEALLLRRMEGLLFQTAAMARARAPWGLLLQELIEGIEPVTELGREHRAWLQNR